MNRKFILARKNMKHNNAVDEENDMSDDNGGIPDMPRDEDFDIYDDPPPIDKKGKKKKKSNDDDDGVYYDTEPWDARLDCLMMNLNTAIKFTKLDAYYYGRWEGDRFQVAHNHHSNDKTSLDSIIKSMCASLRNNANVKITNQKISRLLPMQYIADTLEESAQQLQLRHDMKPHTIIADYYYMSTFGVCILWGMDLIQCDQNTINTSEFVWTFLKLPPEQQENYCPFSLRVAHCIKGFNNKGVVRTQSPANRICFPTDRLRRDICDWYMNIQEPAGLDMRMFMAATYDWIPPMIPLKDSIPLYTLMLNEHPSMTIHIAPVLKSAILYRALALHPIYSHNIDVKARVYLQVQLLRNIDCYADQILAYWNWSPRSKHLQFDPLELFPLLGNLNWDWNLASVKARPCSVKFGVFLANLRRNMPFVLDNELHKNPQEPENIVLTQLTLAHVTTTACSMFRAYFKRPFILKAVRNPVVELDWIMTSFDDLVFFIMSTLSWLDGEDLLLEFCAAIFNVPYTIAKAVFMQRKMDSMLWYIRPSTIVNPSDYGFRYLNKSMRCMRATHKPLKILSGEITQRETNIMYI